ncbi:nuclear receptor coactivator 6-like isoform X1 [Haliotis rufescens]|uniref:nuclear receptor coactivator 6-like isoform X1 n=1 Tax=Haliotis rufescens TaxID=6454 RepID=UPI00201FA0F0|nr:nuclear receptor coactivator 6-like isoform X1 [Haliotis rufescens]
MLEMGPQEDYIETVLTCEGDFDDPQLHSRLEKFRRSLKDLLLTDMHKLILKKVEPWNSVRVTFNIPKEAALRLKQLAQQGNAALRELGVLAVQIQGDQVVSLTIAGRNNERTELILRTAEVRPGQSAVSVFDTGLQSSDELNSPGPSNVEVTRKNIADYLRQGTSLFDTIINQSQPGPGNGVFKSPNVVATSSEPIPFRANNVISTSPGNTATVTSQTPVYMSNFPPGRSPTGYPASPSANYPTSPSASRSPVHQPGLKYPSPPGLPPGIPTAPPSMGSMNHVRLPPPPPYPGGNTVNNIPRPGKAVSVSSPLLVNLLQTEPLVAGFNNLNGSKMLPPQEGGPPAKKRRRRKPKEATKPSAVPSDGEVPIQSVLNPALDAATMLSNDRVESSMDSTNAGHPADPNVSLNPNQRLTPTSVAPMLGSSSQLNISPLNIESRLNPNESVGSGTQPPSESLPLGVDSLSEPSIPNLIEEKGFVHEQPDPFPPEITAGKIINPYTGQLEPMDRSPVKSAKLGGGGVTQVKNKAQRMKSASKPNRENVHDVFLNRGKKHVNKKSATVTSEDVQALAIMTGQMPVAGSSDVFGVSKRTVEREHCQPSERSPDSAAAATTTTTTTTTTATAQSANVPQQIYAEAQQSSQCASSTAVSVSTSLSSTAMPSPTESLANVTIGMGIMNSAGPSVASLASAKASSPPYPSGPLGHPLLETSGKRQTQPAQSVSHSAELHNSDSKSPLAIDSVLQCTPAASEAVLSVAQSAKASAKVDSVSLLNSPSTRTTDSNCMSASPENKMPSEGDDNSNHSGIIGDITADNPTSAGSFLDSGSGKVYNHDSGVGSSSERSDDTPSEPGDSEFRSTHPVDSDELSKSQKLLDCKPESKQMTVGYVMDNDHMPQQHKDKSDLAHMPFTTEKVASLGQIKNHTNLMYGQTPSDLPQNNQVTVLQWSTKDSKPLAGHKHIPNYELLMNSQSGKLKNGPLLPGGSVHKNLDRHSSSPSKSKTVADIESPHNSNKLSYSKGPSSADGELQTSSPPTSQPDGDQGNEHPPFSADTLKTQTPPNSLSTGDITDRTSNFQCNTNSPEWLNLPGLASQPVSSVCDTDTSDLHELSQSYAQSGRLEPHSPGGLGQCITNSDGRCQASSPKSAAEKFFPGIADIDGMQTSARSMPFKGGQNPDGLKGSNITSKYSKRSSPVNVNMLNHIYAPGLPLPRRLTESIQRLVKPLGDLPQMRACKSPGASGSKQGPNGEKSPRGVHGARSPGASVPRSSPNGGIPTSQAALASSMPSNLPNLQQNTLSGGAVSVNCTTGMSVSASVSQTFMSLEGQSGSHMAGSVNLQSSLADRNFYSSPQQHSTPYSTYSPPSENQLFDSNAVAASQANVVDGIPPSQHPDLTDSAVMSDNQQTNMADQLVPLSMSHKCNTHSGPLSQANPSYAKPVSASADVSDLSAVNKTHSHSDLNDSAASHNSTTTEPISTSNGDSSSAPLPVNCVQSEAAPTAGESQHQGDSVSLADGQHLSQHSTVHSAGSSDAVDVASNAQRQLHAPIIDTQPNPSDSSDVPKLSSVDGADVDSVDQHPQTVGEAETNEGIHISKDVKEEVDTALSQDATIAECSAKDTKHETQDLCSSEAANISDTPPIIEPIVPLQTETSDIPITEYKDENNASSIDSPVGIPSSDPVEGPQDGNDQEEPKPIKKVAELLIQPTANLNPSVESMRTDSAGREEDRQSENKISKIADEVEDVETESKSQFNTVQPPVLQPEPESMPTRRITRKRKSTHSESDGKENDTDAAPKMEVPEITAKSIIAYQNSDAASSAKTDSAAVSGPRTRETRRHPHGEEKVKNPEDVNDKPASDKQMEKLGHLDKQQLSPKDGTQERKVDGIGAPKEDDLSAKRGNTNRRNKSLPVAGTEKPQPYSFFDISIIRGRTRSQSAPMTENKDQKIEKEKEESPDSQKRSTRSSRQKDLMLLDAPSDDPLLLLTDHPEQPVAKRRRSRDHR